MSESLQSSEPSYSAVELSGPPEAVARLMAALAAAGDVIFDHRSAPDVRGDVACRAKVVTYESGHSAGSGQAEAVVQSTLRLDPVARPGLGQDEGARRLEEDAAAALAAVEGVSEVVGSRVVAVVSSAGGH
ncbi:hypothetical protein PUR49_07860 [Streptomyces sp. BE147]|uniref:hypothetical protein n=1 Tax=Streptomyces sp. BE147 TaxID=3002524 RepID=UPI002E7A42BD|nr:hypothetical protein [Streptomyces sp. BE147]MEE1736414.1 hypothetical protein [Streptomyces sp. BE147]